MLRLAAVFLRNQKYQQVLGQDGFMLAYMIIMGATGWVNTLSTTCTSETRVWVLVAPKGLPASGPSQAMIGICRRVGIVLIRGRANIS